MSASSRYNSKGWWIVRVGIAILLLSSPVIEANDDNEEEKAPIIVSTEFLNACTFGDVAQVKDLLEQHPDWIKRGRSEQGETCLHVAGIQGQAAVTQLVLEQGADPNVRTSFAQGLRMHPLSWNVYGGHVETAQVLLEKGANVNLDFDSMGQPPTKVTALDICTQIMENNDAEMFVKMKELLLQYGAKLYSELNNDNDPEL
eukprot:CAMPEP_0178911948 /NCGR_PEP_ID=MMETSP0786-20121207/9983_1 /TAXON_ID=186022 /ORGANISM="Thalassionema frauenfeldii, Strain CCMP 1798" /LENGTH=200 /DNA_ID=CAMNT_0020584461 /DNA_START=138 /DNA_END=740 /DNA_ORIENTATION=+